MVRGKSKSQQLEDALLERLDRLERRMQKLRDEREAIQVALASHRADRLRFKGALRKNSFSKLLVEKRILDVLRKSGRPMPTATLYKAAGMIDNEAMPESTFRSHLHRMKIEGLIVSHMRGSYRLPDARN